ncbi:MAG TPA: TMEM175 family protein [Vicinamibacterales bacterium]|nr:TMEM175 family protein [Vicinamibacterales bacterium]
MSKTRLEAFSDAVIAIIITIMVLELQAPHGVALRDLAPLYPKFLSYVLSYVYLGIYWNNHHHMLHAAQRVTGGVLWANLHLLFWLSLVPFTTAWMGENHFASQPTALYGFVLLMAAQSYLLLQRAILKSDGPGSPLARAVGSDRKGLVSRLAYLISIPTAFVAPAVSALVFVAIAIIWFVPDRRVERALES